MALALEGVAVEALGADQPRHRVGELDLAARAFLMRIERAHHFGLEDVAAGQHQIGGRAALRRLLDQPLDRDQPPVPRAGNDDAVAVGLGLGHFEHGDDIAADLLVGPDHLGEAAGLAEHQLVGKQHRERLVADDLARAPDGMAEAERLLLADRDDRAGREARAGKRVERLAARGHGRLELVGNVEMVLERALAAAGDEDHLLDPRLARLLDRILDQRPIEHGQHFLGHRLGGGKEAGAEPGDREDGLADGLHCGAARAGIGIGRRRAAHHIGIAAIRRNVARGQVEAVVVPLLGALEQLVEPLGARDRRRRQQLVGGHRAARHGRRRRHMLPLGRRQRLAQAAAGEREAARPSRGSEGGS